MFCNCQVHRRGLFRLGAGLALSAGLVRAGQAVAQSPPASASRLPGRQEVILRGGHVLTMDPALGDLPTGDVHVRDGTIIAVGPSLSAPGAQVIDCRNMIVLPGFVDTHWHLWATQLRMIVRADDPQAGYFPTTLRVGGHYTPDDSYVGVRLGVAEGLLSGITTVHNWSHNTVSPAHADAELQALKDLGVRARFSYGAGQSHPMDKAMDLQDLARVNRQWTSSDGMLGVGACLRQP